MVALDPARVRELKKEMYVSDRGVIAYKGLDLYKDFMLITAGCGRGKTSHALEVGKEGLLSRINEALRESFTPSNINKKVEKIKPCEVLFLTSRTVVKQQQEEKHEYTVAPYGIQDFEEGNDNAFLSKEEKSALAEKIRISTAHNFGRLLKENQIKVYPKLIVVDEIPTIFSETVFADDLFYVVKWLENNHKVIKVGLTATPEFLMDYIKQEEKVKDKFNFKIVDKELGNKYSVDKINVVHRGSASTYLKLMDYSKDNRVLVYMRSANQCYELSKQFPNAAFLISKHCKTKDKLTGELLCDIMQKQPHLSHIRETGTFPDDIFIVFLNSAYREGLDLKDARVKSIVCEASDMLTIKQVLGRMRQDMKLLCVINNNRYKKLLNDNIEDICEFMDAIETTKDNPIAQGVYIGARLERQRLSEVPNIVYEYRGEYFFNYYAIAFFKYQRDCYHTTERSMNAEYRERDTNIKIENSREYFTNNLQSYATNTIMFIDAETIAAESRIKEKLETFTAIERFFDTPLDKDLKNELCEALGLTNSQYRLAKWTTVREELVKAGLKITDKRVVRDGKKLRVSIIEK